jgi:hypothetical protein
MPRTVKISLKDITKDIRKATAALKSAQRKAKNRRVKTDLAKNIKSLEAIEKQVRIVCHGSHMILVPLDWSRNE